jgi:hypothetical protein
MSNFMKCLTNKECLEWLESHRIDAVSAESWPVVVGDYEVYFAAPNKARDQGQIACDLVTWLGEFETGLLWLSDWPFYRPHEMAITLGLRHAHGEHRQIIEAPGHVFEFKERAELVGWVSLMMGFGWDGHLFISPFCGSMFQTSHEDFVWVATTDPQKFRDAREFVHKYEVEIYRETKVG